MRHIAWFPLLELFSDANYIMLKKNYLMNVQLQAISMNGQLGRTVIRDDGSTHSESRRKWFHRIPRAVNRTCRNYVAMWSQQSGSPGTFMETINNKYWAIFDLEFWVHGLFTFIHEYILYFIQSLCSLFMKSWKLRGYYVTMVKWGLKLDRWVEYDRAGLENGPFWYTFILIFLTINN